ncbi:MAG TPA: TRAP transporter small permease [Sphingomonadaceae bacterium]|nr:TRAP transporter small permease [Sphingomonadaceae bacterium]
MLNALGAVSRWISRLSLGFAALGLILMVGIITWQVFARYGLQASPAWSEQAALAIMLWYVLIAAAVGVRERFHIALTSVFELLPGGWARFGRMISLVSVLAFGLAAALWGGELVARTWAHDVPTLGVPRGFVYLPLPLSGALVAFFAIEHLLAEAQSKKVEPLWD